jgi:hypothetical protein
MGIGNYNYNYNTIGRKRRAFVAEYGTIYDAFTTKPSDSVAAEQNKLVKSLVNSGVWAKLDTFYVLAGHTNGAGESLINWINPGTFDATAVNIPAFVAFEGFTGNGTTAYIDLNWNANTQGVNYVLNSASQGLYSRTSGIENVTELGADDNTYSSSLRIKYASNLTSDIINQNRGEFSGQTDASNDGLGLYILSRTSNIVAKVYRNGIAYSGTNINTADGIPNANFNAFKAGGQVSPFSTRQLSMLFTGSGLDQTDATNLYNAFQAYMTSNGKQV